MYEEEVAAKNEVVEEEEDLLDYTNYNWMMPPNETRYGAVHLRKSNEEAKKAD